MGDPLFAKYGKTASAGEILFREGEQGSEMFVVRSGSVRVFVTAENQEKTLALLGPGEFIGEMSVLTGQPRSATAVVHEDTELLVVGGKVLEEMVISNAEIALRLMRKLARRLEAMDALMQVLLPRDPKRRVIENLKRLSSLHGGKSSLEVKLQADYEGMAEQVGLELDEVRDIIARLKRAGALKEEGGSWIIADPSRLGEVLEFLKMKEQYR
jgi:CRP-like cAMP-binding protein